MNELTLYSIMTRIQAWALVVTILFITSQPATCDDSETLHIVPSTSSPCAGELTGEPCITFSQYLSGEYRRYYKTDPIEWIVLEFGPGCHSIGSYRTVFASQVISFTMRSEHSAEIHCDYESQYLITNAHNVYISGINFVFCNLQVESVTNFALEKSSFSRIGPESYYRRIDDVLYIRSSSATIKGCNFTKNYRRLHIDKSSMELHHTNFIQNSNEGTDGGGALLIENTRSTVTISHCSFIGNTAYFGGGAASIRNATVSIQNSTFSQNRAIYLRDGGVFVVEDSDMTILGSTFDNNTAEGNGGVLSLNYLHSTLFISHTSFTNNQAVKQGGVLYLRRKGSKARINKSYISSNNATRGGFATVHEVHWKLQHQTSSTILLRLGRSLVHVIVTCQSRISYSAP